MRSPRHMAVALSLVASLAATGSLLRADPPPPPPLPPRSRRKASPTRDAILDTGKPPMNGAREMQRRLRQMQRKADKQSR